MFLFFLFKLNLKNVMLSFVILSFLMFHVKQVFFSQVFQLKKSVHFS